MAEIVFEIPKRNLTNREVQKYTATTTQDEVVEAELCEVLAVPRPGAS